MSKNDAPLPTLDVVIPCYNEEADLDDCFTCLRQDTGIRRIIIVDNASTDSSYSIARKWSKKDKRISVVKESRQGVRYARDTGIAKTDADIVARIDVDTHIQAGWSRAIRSYYRDNPDIKAASGAIKFYDLPFREFSAFMMWLFMVASNRIVGGNNTLYGANMSIRRSTWDTIIDTIHNEKGIMEDLSISLAIDARGEKVGYIHDGLAFVSGRRARTSPARFVEYNNQWWRTYKVYGHHVKAFFTRCVVWIGNICQFVAAFGLRFHDPKTNKFRLRHFKNSYNERIIP